jgi:erythromycin esterase-like protein
MVRDSILAQAIAEQATPLAGADTDFDLLLDRIGDARFVLLGEATHGTHQFYKIRAELTKRLIREKGFCAIACEADWPDSYRVNRYIRGVGDDDTATESLADFHRFPQWMWRNADILDLVGWLRAHNDRIGEAKHKVGFYGLDVYSLHGSMGAVLSYLQARDPDAARRARLRYGCFDVFGEEPQTYGQAISMGIASDCQEEVVQQLVELTRRRGDLMRHDGLVAAEEHFEAEQNARVVANAEQYYRQMYLGGVSTWNLRDTHMMDTLDSIATHMEQMGRNAKMIVWAHNSHVGDSAAMAHRAERDEITLGHLCRKRHPGDSVLVGFTTYTGTVTAASDWGAKAERKLVRPGMRGSYESLFHQTGIPSFLLMLDDLGEATAALHDARLERAIGVVYRPQTERWSHYFDVRLAQQLDAVIHVDQTRALEPLERTPLWEGGELPETYPTGL